MAHPKRGPVAGGVRGVWPGRPRHAEQPLFADGVRWHFPGRSPFGGDYAGIGEVMTWLGRSFEASGGTIASSCTTASERRPRRRADHGAGRAGGPHAGRHHGAGVPNSRPQGHRGLDVPRRPVHLRRVLVLAPRPSPCTRRHTDHPFGRGNDSHHADRGCRPYRRHSARPSAGYQHALRSVPGRGQQSAGKRVSAAIGLPRNRQLSPSQLA